MLAAPIINPTFIRHIDLVMDYRDSVDGTDDQMDKMIEDGEIEFGTQWPDGTFTPDKTRQSVYSSIEKMVNVNGRPQGDRLNDRSKERG